jgi:hypothetical protein
MLGRKNFIGNVFISLFISIHQDEVQMKEITNQNQGNEEI